MKTKSLAVAAAILAAPALASAQVASALLIEDGVLPGAPGQTVGSISNTAVNHAGGYAVSINGEDGVSTFSHVWGNATGGAGTVLRTESTFGNYEQTSFESFFGLSDAGEVAYSPSGTDTVTMTTSIEAVFIDDVPVLIEFQPTLGLPGQFWTFGSRPTITADGIPFWVGGFADTPGATTQGRGLFRGLGQVPLLVPGDVVTDLPFPLDDAATVSFDYRVSEFGTNYIAEVQMESGSMTNDGAMVINGDGLLVDGSVVREGDPVPAAAGGLAGENWDNFDLFGINEAGDYLITGDTDAAAANNEIVVVNGQIIHREGDALSGATLTGSITGAALNEDGDVAFIWQIESDAGAIEALFLNGGLLLEEGDQVDMNNDGVVDNDFVEFSGISALSMSDRDADGNVKLYFTGDAIESGAEVEAFFCLETSATFIGIGCALEGVSGDPDLSGEGPLTSGSSNSVSLANAAPSAVSLLFVSLVETPVPFKGGTLKTVPILTSVGLTTSATGTIDLPFAWPAGVPSDLDVYFQWAIQDAAAVKGVALSNALRATTP